MTRTLSFFVPGRPFAKQRPRFGKGRTYTHPETVAAEAAVRWYAKRALPAGFVPFAGPVRLVLDFRFDPAPSRSAVSRARMAGAWHAVRPDVDNLEKLVMDALNPHDQDPTWPGVWTDDALICRKTSDKRWADAANPEGTTVIVSEIDA